MYQKTQTLEGRKWTLGGGKIVRHHLWMFPMVPKHIDNPITAMGFSAMFTFQLDNTKM